MNAEEPLARFERLARRLVEGTFRSLFGGPLAPLDLGARLAQAIEDNSQGQSAPNQYAIRLHPHDHAAVMAAFPDVVAELTEFVQTLVQQAGLSLTRQPEVSLLIDARVAPRKAEVEATHWRPMAEATRVRTRPLPRTDGALRQADAFLIVDGLRHVTLNRPVYTIGRRDDNDIVIGNPNVSRRHAQLRWRYGRFVIFDLGSRGGTRVNGQLIRECVLHPGDVITLSTVALIYGEGQDGAPPKRDGDTMVRPAAGGDAADEQG